MIEGKPNRPDGSRNMILAAAFAGVLLVLAWTLFLEHAAVDDPVRSHESIVQVFRDGRFFIAFAIMLVQVVLSSVIGAAIGVTVGSIIRRSSSWLSQGALRFVSFGLWFSFCFFWVLPIWNPGKVDQVDAAFLIAGFVVGVLAILPTTALSACYYFLSVCELSDSLERGGTWKYTLRETILLALLASLIFQVWIHPYGWNWFDFIVSKSSAAGYLVVILLVGFLFLVELIFKSGFKNAATRRGAIIIKEVQNRNWNSLLESVLFVGSCMVLWQLASVPLAKYFLISSPANTLTAAYRILTDKLNIAGIEFIRWED